MIRNNNKQFDGKISAYTEETYIRRNTLTFTIAYKYSIIYVRDGTSSQLER